MLFNSYIFIFIFLPVTLLGFHLLGGRSLPRLTMLWLVTASLFFYGWWNWRFVFLLLWAITSNWVAGTQIDKHLCAGSKRLAKNWMRTAIVGDLVLLGVFKYYDFFAVELSNLLGSSATIPLLELTLPVGISFFTFQAMSYVIDLHRRDIDPMPMLDFAVYLSFLLFLLSLIQKLLL